MSLSLDALDSYKKNTELQKLFNGLDNICIPGNNKIYRCESFDYKDTHETFTPYLEKNFNILKRSEKQKNIYINEINLNKYESCVYYKYWFYHKIIKHNSGNIDIKNINQIWNQNIRKIYNNIFAKRCNFRANTLEDVKILKVLYDHIFFYNYADNKYNLIKEIKKCEFCKHLKNYLGTTFVNGNISCSHFIPYVICMEYRDRLKDIIILDKLSSLSCENDE
ncbi:PIR Superfamily Protein [Plasmodium ovale curtisi]|uniref:PIR Superfamily Protein n=1 Tax=Plasmodium ovale curtisi TaxID=864141 RepID=A0A1A8WK29_PLAOA|nr:PIR Superfamily Protein [Plasmodium ovale curtisi]